MAYVISITCKRGFNTPCFIFQQLISYYERVSDCAARLRIAAIPWAKEYRGQKSNAFFALFVDTVNG